MIGLNLWTNPSDDADVRLYIDGTTRNGVYFKRSDDGRVVWSSRTASATGRSRTGDHYGKVDKDRTAAHEAAEALGLRLGADPDGTAWAAALAIATAPVRAPETAAGIADDQDTAAPPAAASKIIHTIAAARWTRYGKWRVELHIRGESTVVAWMTPTQYDYLRSAFDHTRDGFSGHGVDVTGEFDERGRYVRCSATRAPSQPRHHTPLIEEVEADGALLDQD